VRWATLTNRHGAGLYAARCPHQPERLALQLGAYPRGIAHQRAGTEWLSHPQSGSQGAGARLQTLGPEVLDSGGCASSRSASA
jgi:hypothetical protein